MTKPDDMLERRLVHYTGRVQGVGFRATTAQIAANYSVRGHVSNLADGRVELLVEGIPDELDRFFEAVQSRMADFIKHVDRSRLPRGDEPLPPFQIRT